jgi:predicted nucleic-acid-binding Zn-ribbon protein
MKETKTCPKCKGKSVSFANRIFSGGGLGGKEYIGLDPKMLGGMEKRFVAYICNGCGYSELYLKPE